MLPAIEQRGPIGAWIVDDTGIQKKGQQSVGVAQQNCGPSGKQENCKVVGSLSSREASLPAGWRLTMPEEWARERERQRRAGVPEEIEFETKPEIALGLIRRAVEESPAAAPRKVQRRNMIALGLIRRAVEEDVPAGVVLADAPGTGSPTRAARPRLDAGAG